MYVSGAFSNDILKYPIYFLKNNSPHKSEFFKMNIITIFASTFFMTIAYI